MREKGNYILWLPSWYPNRLQPFDGDFIQRHAIAASANIPVRVIKVVNDKRGMITSGIEVEQSACGQLAETIVYVNTSRSWSSAGKMFRHYKTLIRDCIRQHGTP